LMMNHLSLSPKDQEKGQTFFDSIFKAVFPKGQIIDVDGNWMLINEANRILR